MDRGVARNLIAIQYLIRHGLFLSPDLMSRDQRDNSAFLYFHLKQKKLVPQHHQLQHFPGYEDQTA